MFVFCNQISDWNKTVILKLRFELNRGKSNGCIPSQNQNLGSSKARREPNLFYCEVNTILLKSISSIN